MINLRCKGNKVTCPGMKVAPLIKSGRRSNSTQLVYKFLDLLCNNLIFLILIKSNKLHFELLRNHTLRLISDNFSPDIPGCLSNVDYFLNIVHEK